MLQRAPPTDHGPWEGARSVKLETRSRMIKSTAIGRTLNWSMERLGARTPRVAHLLLNRNSRSRRSSRSSGITLLVNPFGNARNLFRVPRKMQIASYQKWVHLYAIIRSTLYHYKLWWDWLRVWKPCSHGAPNSLNVIWLGSAAKDEELMFLVLACSTCSRGLQSPVCKTDFRESWSIQTTASASPFSFLLFFVLFFLSYRYTNKFSGVNKISSIILPSPQEKSSVSPTVEKMTRETTTVIGGKVF